MMSVFQFITVRTGEGECIPARQHRSLVWNFDDGKFRKHHKWLRLMSDEGTKGFEPAEVECGCLVLAPRFRNVQGVYISYGGSAGCVFPLIKAKLLLTARSTKYHMTIGYALQELEYVITL